MTEGHMAPPPAPGARRGRWAALAVGVVVLIAVGVVLGPRLIDGLGASGAQRAGAGSDGDLISLLDELPYRESAALPLLIVGDLELAWEASAHTRPAGSSEWFEGPTDVRTHPLMGATGAFPPGPPFQQTVTRLQEVEFAELVGFGPIDVDRFAEWHGSDSWAATLRLDLEEIEDKLDRDASWRAATVDETTWFERVADDGPSFSDALLLGDAGVVAGPAPDAGQPPPAQLGGDPRRLSDAPGLSELVRTLEGEAVWAWIFHAPPVVDLELESDPPLPRPYLAGAYASMAVEGAIHPAFVLVHETEDAARENAAALERGETGSETSTPVTRQGRVVQARTDGAADVVTTVLRLRFDALAPVAPSR